MILIPLSGMISMFVSLFTWSKILLKHHTLQLDVMVWILRKIKDLRRRSAKNLIMKKRKILKGFKWEFHPDIKLVLIEQEKLERLR